jgi:hypothetical protein
MVTPAPAAVGATVPLEVTRTSSAAPLLAVDVLTGVVTLVEMLVSA